MSLDLLAGQPQPHVVLRQQHASRLRAKTSGSCSRTHSSLGAVKPGMAMLPVMRAQRGLAPFELGAFARALRPSFHRIAGRSGLVRRVEQRRAVHLARQADAAHGGVRGGLRRAQLGERSERGASTSRRGSCSDHSGCGRDTAAAHARSPTTRCARRAAAP